MIANRDYKWMEDILQWELPLRAIETGHLQFAFSALTMFMAGMSDPDVRFV